MQAPPTEIRLPNVTGRARRIWHGHGCSRFVVENDRELPPANIIDEAIASFARTDAPDKRTAVAASSHDIGPMNPSLVVGLSAQLEALDRQRDQLAQLLRNIDVRRGVNAL
jgi:hypothetical protein